MQKHYHEVLKPGNTENTWSTPALWTPPPAIKETILIVLIYCLCLLVEVLITQKPGHFKTKMVKKHYYFVLTFYTLNVGLLFVPHYCRFTLF